MKIAAIIAAATVGDGIFALPYVFARAGWLIGLAYLVVLSSVVAFAHVLYFKALRAVGERERLLGLVRKRLPSFWFWTGFVAIVGGLFIGLVAYLVIGARFVLLAAPGLPPMWALYFFWGVVTLPVLLSDRRAVVLEVAGILASTAVILFIFGAAWPHAGFGTAAPVGPVSFFLPFGVILLSLAGWTGIEPAYDAAKRDGWIGKRRVLAMVAAGTFFVALLYLLFVLGVLGAGVPITSDTVSGLIRWPAWERIVVAVLGAIAVWTAYMPISREITNTLTHDLGWNRARVQLAVVVLPALLVSQGLNDFFTLVSVGGGVFLSAQYMLIVAAARSVLPLTRVKRFLLAAVTAVFALAAVYSLYAFVVRWP